MAALVSPMATTLKFKLVEESVTGALPVPVRVTVCVPALSLMVRDPEAGPTAVGANDTWIVHWEPGWMLVPQVLD